MTRKFSVGEILAAVRQIRPTAARSKRGSIKGRSRTGLRSWSHRFQHISTLIADMSRSQRLYRERKVQRITDLQDEIRRLQSQASALQEEHRNLHLEVCRIETENDVLRSSLATSRTYGLVSRATVCGTESGRPRKGILLKDALTRYGGIYHASPS